LAANIASAPTRAEVRRTPLRWALSADSKYKLL
jgi:hypothetical protein